MLSERKLPFVSVVMPALNEERYIASALVSLLPTETCGFGLEIIVVDGGSTDATVGIVEMLTRADKRIRLLANEKRVQSAGVNMAARLADPRSTMLVRADCHAGYPPDFVAVCVRALRDSGAASVVVCMHTVGATCLQRAVAAAQNSPLGNGGAAHRKPGGSRFVDHGHHAAFDRQIFLDVGGYDEEFRHNEDAELDARLIASGHRIWMSGEAAITYYPRASLTALARQYAGYGAGRALTAFKHAAGLRARQLLPVAAFIACCLSAGLGLVHPGFLLIAGVYVAACLLWGLCLAVRAGKPCLALAGLAAVVMHLAWGAGFLKATLLLRSGRLRLGSGVRDPVFGDAGRS